MKKMTTKEFLELPDDGVKRWLIDGELRDGSRVVYNRRHSRVLIRVGQILANWLDSQPAPRGEILGGEASIILLHDPDTTVGVDVVYISPDVIAAQTDESSLIDGIPTLAVEILAPNDIFGRIDEKIARFRRANVPLVWVLDPFDQTVFVYRPKARPRMFNADDELSGDSELPGFSVPVARLFE